MFHLQLFVREIKSVGKECLFQTDRIMISYLAQNRSKFLCILFLRYNRKRVEEIGPDRACAEWLLRCGGSIRFKNWGSFIANYKTIPIGAPGQFKIEEIRAVKACITSEGFAYLG
jgi:H+-transporting ATP synthase F0 complex subunit s